MKPPDLRNAQLFLDDTWIADCGRVSRVWHEARKYPDPVLCADEPWEYNCPVAYGSVLHWRGGFHAWYCTWSRLSPPRACYARSDDGVHWHKPRLGLHEFGGSKENNIVLVSKTPTGLIDDLTVIDDPDDAKYPLKMLYWDSHLFGPDARKHRGIWAAGSSDAVHWKDLGVALPGFGDRFNALGQKLAGRYVVLGRPAQSWSWGHRYTHGRTAWHTHSRDLKRWSKPVLSLAADADDPTLMEIYSVVPFAYEGLVLGGIERMHMAPDKLDTEIAWSYDAGVTWRRSAKRPSFIPWGAPGRFDSDWINLTANAPIVRNGRLWFYYSGRSGAHDSPHPHNHGAIGLATLRLEGFCSLRAEEAPGFVLTPTMTWPGGDLLVNLDARRRIDTHPRNIMSGALRVEVRDHRDRAIQGYTLEDCSPLSRNTADYPRASAAVRWKTRNPPVGRAGRSLDRLKARQVRLLFELRDAHLYSFRAGSLAP